MGLWAAAMEPFVKLFGDLLVFVYHCFDRIVIHGYLSGLSRPEQVVHFFRRIVGVPVISKEVLSQRTCTAARTSAAGRLNSPFQNFSLCTNEKLRTF